MKTFQPILYILYLQTFIILCSCQLQVKYKYHVIYYDTHEPYVEWVKEGELLETLYRQNKHILLIFKKALNNNDLIKKFTALSEERSIKDIIHIDSTSFSSMVDGFVNLLNKTEIKLVNKSISTIFNDVFNYFNMQNHKSLFIFNNAKATNVMLQNLDQYVTDDMKIKVIVITDEREWDFTKYATFYIMKVYKDQSVPISNSTFIINHEYTGPGRLRKNRTSNEIMDNIRENWTYITRVSKRQDNNNYNNSITDESIHLWPWMDKLLKVNRKVEPTTETSEEQWLWVNDQLLQFNSKNLIRN